MADNRTAEPWLRSEISNGLLSLMSLSLPGHPPYDTIKMTAYTWCDVLMAENITWDADADIQRLRAGFRALARNSERWPQPRHLLASMPDRPKPLQLPEGKPNPDNLKRLAEMFRGFKEALEKKGRFI